MLKSKTKSRAKSQQDKSQHSTVTARTPDVVAYAVFSFSDSLTGKDFRAGQKIEGWDQERIAEYKLKGYVTEIEPLEKRKLKVL